ncbi:MAG: hypothetical protein DRJ42_19390 [Deltaproteobacteria bacterium]|nr:MAG: hypothetical protein DRJ42_19390 [Deltaproteobacteria bacterium]
MKSRPVLAAAAAAFFITACGDSGAGSDADVGVDAGRVAAPPQIPWLATGVPPLAFTPCPSGWREVSDSGVTTCEPYPEAGAADCAAGDAHFPGEAGCRPIGDPCPSDDYASTLPTDALVLYVNPRASTGGDGARGAPFQDPSDVPWGSLAAGTTVALAKGTYDDALEVPAGVAVVGACVAETIITGVAFEHLSVLAVTTAGEPALFRNLTIVDVPRVAIWARDGFALEVDGVLVERSKITGVLATASSSLVARNLVVRDTQHSSGMFGRGVSVEGGSRLEGSRMIVEGSFDFGISAADRDSEVVLSDVVVRGTRPRPGDMSFGGGIGAGSRARIDATRVLVEANHDFGVASGGLETVVTLTDAIIRDTRPPGEGSGGAGGAGIAVLDGGRAELTRVHAVGNHQIGIAISAPDTTAVLEHVVVSDTTPNDTDDVFGRGINVQEGARLDASHVVVQRNHDVGIFLGGPGVNATLTNTVVRDTLPRASNGGGGSGISVQTTASLDASQVLVERNHEVGIVVLGEDAEAHLVDVVVRNTEPRQENDFFGYGICAQATGTITGERVVVDGAYELGLFAIAGGTITMSDLAIQRVERSQSDDPSRVTGYALAAISATVDVTGFEVSDSTTCGLFVAAGTSTGELTSLDVRSGIVERSVIGACIQVDGYDLSRLMRDVEYRDNELNLDVTMLPVPEGLGASMP